MLTHEHEDPLGDRHFTYCHRDMGDGFRHVGNDLCLCGPIRLQVGEEPQRTNAIYARLDVQAHRMVN